MPGITGIIGASPAARDRETIRAMVKCMMHEKFYTSGTYLNEKLGLAIGWTGQPGAFSDGSPIWNERKDVALFFTGEDFAEPGDLRTLQANGQAVDLSNARYLVELYDKLGLQFIEKLNGWFSGVLVDLRQEKIVLFNDRYGMGRIYLHEQDGNLFFSSEAKSLLKVLPGARKLDLKSLAEVYSWGCPVQNRTLFEGISLLPGASRWTFEPKRPIKKETYFRKETWENQPLLSGADYYQQLKETFARVLPRYLRREPGVGMSLTGGLDGRMIMAWAASPPGTLPCYTFGGTYRACTDVRAARKVAEFCRQPHQTIPVDGEFLKQFSTLAEKAIYVSDGAMDVTGSVELYINRIAREIAPVRLTGNYGDEVLRGAIAFKPSSAAEAVCDPQFAEQVRSASQTYADERRTSKLSFVAFKQVPWHHYSRLSLERSQLTVRSPYLDNDLVALIYRAPAELAVDNRVSLRLIADGNPALSRIPTDRGLVYPPVPMVTRAANLYQNFTFKAEYAYDYGMPQWLARADHALKPLQLERFFLGRHKFHHFRVWYRDHLAEYIREILLDSRTRSRPYLRGAALEPMVQGHLRGNRNCTREIHKVLTSELIERQLIEQQ